VSHPYTSAPRTAFWSRAVAADWHPADLVAGAEPYIAAGERVMTAGSCFASNLVPYLEKAGLSYLRTEGPHPAVPYEERFGYDKFTAAYGNIYTVRQLLQLLRRAFGRFRPAEDRWHVGESVVDALRPGLAHHARSDREFDLLTAQHLAAVREAFDMADVLIFTLGLTEGWISEIDGTVFPACPGTVAGEFDPSRHVFHNFTAAEIAADMDAFVGELRERNARVRLILTVSPVPLVATATAAHVLVATTYSKSVLRAAAGEASRRLNDVVYFPAYEIVTGPQAPYEFFEADRRSVARAGIDAVMEAFLSRCGRGAVVPRPVREHVRDASAVSQALADAECEEAMADRSA
jgi:hypothetical protein